MVDGKPDNSGPAAANAYCQVLATSTDNNVKLVVLDRIEDLASSQREIMQELVMDILRALSSPNLDIRRKALDIALDLTTAKSIDVSISRRTRSTVA